MTSTAKRFSTLFTTNFFWSNYEWQGKKLVSSYLDTKIVFPTFYKIRALWTQLEPNFEPFERNFYLKTQDNKKFLGRHAHIEFEDLKEDFTTQKLFKSLKENLARKLKSNEEDEINKKVSQFSIPLELSLLHLLSPFSKLVINTQTETVSVLFSTRMKNENSVSQLPSGSPWNILSGWGISLISQNKCFFGR